MIPEGKTLEELLAERIAQSVADALPAAVERLERVWREQTPDEWMDHERGAADLARSPDALYRMVAAGEIPAHKLGGRNAYSRREVDEAVRRL